MPRTRTLTLLVVVTCLALAGCSSGTPGDGTENGSTDDAEWCQTGESTEWTNPETGERVSLTVNGTTTYEGREVCVSVWETNDPDSETARMEFWYSEDNEYTRIVTYDAQGNVISEVESTGQVGDQTTAEQPGDGTTNSDWCPTGDSFEYTEPETGERVSLVYEGIVTQDGRDVCKAVWETDNPDDEVARMEYYFDEEGTYTRIVSYDAQGNIIDDTVVDSSENS